MSGAGVTMEFKRKFTEWQGSEYALGFNNDTAALQAFSLGAIIVLADIDPVTLCIEDRITDVPGLRRLGFIRKKYENGSK